MYLEKKSIQKLSNSTIKENMLVVNIINNFIGSFRKLDGPKNIAM